MIKICLYCKKNFEDVTKNQLKLYCLNCKPIIRKFNYDNWKNKNPKQVKEYKKDWDKKNRETNREYLFNYRKIEKNRIKMNNYYFESTKKNPEKYGARLKVKHDKEKNPNKYKNYCECCDKTNVIIEQHHEDYLKPLEVIALCKSCHTYIHKVETRCDILSILLFKGVWGKGGELKSLSN